MSEEKFIASDADGPKLVPVEVKDHSKDPVITTKSKRERTVVEKEVDAEIIAKGKDAVKDFDETQAIAVPAKKRGRPKKVEPELSKQWRCSTCREMIDDKNVMKIGAGSNRYAVFCPYCQKSLGFEDPVVHETVADLIRNNPTGKNAKA